MEVRTRYTATPGDSSPRNEIVARLYEAGQSIVSGQDLARDLGVSRPAVWKHVQALIKDGVPIEAVRNEGYRLRGGVDLIVPSVIQKSLRTAALGRVILRASETGSTNEDAKAFADMLASEAPPYPHGTAVIAEIQVSGKGRLGRVWTSPHGGVFLSLILRPTLAPAKVPAMALAVGYATALALRDSFGLEAQVKWPNDILIGGRKVSGILCEMRAEIDMVSYVVAGIGINVNLTRQELPPEVRDAATSLAIELGRKVDRNLVVASVLNSLEPAYEDFVRNGLSRLAPGISEISAYLGEPVVIKNRSASWEEDERGMMRGIDGEGRLLLETSTGQVKAISAGDLSLRSEPS